MTVEEAREGVRAAEESLQVARNKLEKAIKLVPLNHCQVCERWVTPGHSVRTFATVCDKCADPFETALGDGRC